MQTLTSILLFLMLFQQAGYLVIFKARQYQIRKEIKHRIKAGVPENELILLKIPQALEKSRNPVFQRIHAREFRYDGKMYDIVRSQVNGDTTWYYCIADVQETRLFANLEELVNQNMHQNPEQKQQNEKLLRLLGAFYYNQSSSPYFVHFADEINAAGYRFSVKTWAGSPLNPPPEV